MTASALKMAIGGWGVGGGPGFVHASFPVARQRAGCVGPRPGLPRSAPGWASKRLAMGRMARVMDDGEPPQGMGFLRTSGLERRAGRGEAASGRRAASFG